MLVEHSVCHEPISVAEVNHNGEDDWEVRLIDQNDNVEELRKRESFW